MQRQIIDWFKDFRCYKDMPPEEWNNIKTYYNSFFLSRKYPRFFQSYLYLKSERKYFFYGYLDDCFILIKKKKEFGQRVFYLVLPPISLSNNLHKELELINSLRMQGVKTKISDEDIQLYNISKNLYSKDKDNIEHIYDPKHFIDLSKPTFFKFRYYFNKLNKYKEKDLLSISISNKLSADQISRADILTNNWNKYKKMHADLCHHYFNDNNDNMYFEIINKNNNVITSSINEQIHPNHVLITTNYSDYNYQFKDLQINKAIHCLMCKYWVDKIKYINSGSGGWDKTLTLHKRQLRPIKELQIYDTKIENRITEEEYQFLCKG